MMSRSYTNLMDLATGNFPSFPKVGKRLPRVMTVPGIISELDDDNCNSVTSDVLSSVCQDRMIIVANQLPLKAVRRPDNRGWAFSWDEDSLLLQLKDGLTEDLEVVYVGSLKVEVDPNEQDDVAQILLEKFKCVPAFLPPDLFSKFYHGFCKQHLWPLFHYMLPLSPNHGGRFDRSLWQAYVSANKIFADKVMEVISPDDDFVWVHDYHLMVLPTFLRKRFNRLKLGFFLHSPFPSSEIYRTLPVRDEILRALLNSDLIGFHTFDYARHFLSCCSRMLGIEYESKRGYIGLEYYGRTVGIKIMPVGIHMGQLESVLNLADTEWRVGELRDQFKGKKVLLGVDDMDIFKGISLKFLAMEQLLKSHPEWRGKVVLVQIANPARSLGKDVEEVKDETHSTANRINETFGRPGYEPIVLIDRPVPFYERIAFYTIAECAVVTAVRDGMNLTPYEYIVCRQGSSKLDDTHKAGPNAPKKSMLVVSEFIGCSPSLSGAIRVNPWNIDAVAEAMNVAISIPEAEAQLRHEKHFRYVSTHDVAYWAQSFTQDLIRTCADHLRKRCYGIGFGFVETLGRPVFCCACIINMNSKLFCCVSVWRNLFLKTASHFRFSFSILAESNVSNNNGPSENLFVHFVTTRFNISSTDAAKMLKKAPSLGQLKTLDNVEQFICVLNRNGCTEDQIAKIIRLLPRLLGSSVVEPKIQLLKDSGLKGVNLAKIVTKNPCVLTTKLEDLRSKINFLQTVFPTQDFLIKAITRNPSVLKSSLQKTLEPSVAFWENFGFRGIELTKFLLLNLWVLTHSSLTAAQLDFIRKIGLQKESKMYKNVVSVVANSRIEVLEAKVDNLQLCGLSRAEAWELVRVYPPVLNHSEENVKKKMDFMLNHMELSVDFVIKHTRMFSMSLDKVIRPRFSVLQNMASMNEAGKVNPMRLTSIFLMPEAKFVGQIIQGHPKSAALWTVYKKCHG